MNLVKKILVAHGDPSARRRLRLFFADAGFDVRSVATAEAAQETAGSEWFDLVLIDHDLPGAAGFQFVDTLRTVQPTVPVLMLVKSLELPLVVQGIRLGVADVVEFPGDPRALLRRTRALMKIEAPVGDDEVSADDIAAVESMLRALSTAPASASPCGHHTQEPTAEVLRLSKEKTALEALAERLQQEKAALEGELKTLLTHTADEKRLQAELAELRNERELAAATQAAIDAKACALAATRAAIANERNALEEERRRIEATPAGAASSEAVSRERASLHAWRDRLAIEEKRLEEEAAQLRQEVTQFTQERRRWHADLELLRTQEENLRAYETRLRHWQAQLEADHVQWSSTTVRPPTASRSPFQTDANLREAWAKLQRATEIFEAERANTRDERLAMREHEALLKKREEKVRDREIQLAMKEKASAEAAVPPPSALKSFTNAPFAMAKAVFGSKDK